MMTDFENFKFPTFQALFEFHLSRGNQAKIISSFGSFHLTNSWKAYDASGITGDVTRSNVYDSSSAQLIYAVQIRLRPVYDSFVAEYGDSYCNAKTSGGDDNVEDRRFRVCLACCVMTRVAVWAWIVVLALDEVGALGSCPSFCVCDTWYELQHASCTGRHLYSIHTDAPSTVQALDLSNNSISILNNYELKEAGLTRLKYLNLSVNAISEIGLNAFNGLTELTVLDLSRNHLYDLLPDSFVPAKNLRVLRLSKNNFNSHVPKLECPWLTTLTLDSCRISHIPTEMFSRLSNLRTLDLSNNLLIQLDSDALKTLPFLRKLSIEGNPWPCDKLTRDLQIYLAHKSIQYQPVCGKNAEPKKFEKMIVYNPRIKYEKRWPTSNIGIQKNVTKKIPVQVHENTVDCVNTTHKTNFIQELNSVSPYWFFMLGILLGVACGMFICYIWLTKKISCCHGCRRQTDNDVQRVSLLQNLWQFEDSAVSDSAISYPDTPPPPYREVMLQPGLYRNA